MGVAPTVTTLLGLALDGHGWHPDADKHAGKPLTCRYWTQQVQLAEQGLLDFVTFEDSFAPPLPVAASTRC